MESKLEKCQGEAKNALCMLEVSSATITNLQGQLRHQERYLDPDVIASALAKLREERPDATEQDVCSATITTNVACARLHTSTQRS